MVIGLTGVARSGKDTFYAILNKYLKERQIESERLALADALKNELYEFKITDNSVICKDDIDDDTALKFNDINGTWRINNGMLENVDFSDFYWKEVESELFK
jgi:hypothetical protein